MKAARVPLRACRPAKPSQRGVVLVVALVLLMLLTMMVVVSHSTSTTNVLSAANTQTNAEAEAAADVALETTLSDDDFTTVTTSETQAIDLNNDGTTDYTVTVAPAECIEAINNGEVDEDNLSSVSLPAISGTYNTVWDIRATVQDDSTGASVTVHQGVMVQMTEADKLVKCP